MTNRDRAALAILRIGLGVFLLLWSIDKIVAPEATVRIFEHFYKTSISETLAPIVGVAEGVLSLAIVFGVWKTLSYGMGLLVHAISTVSSLPQLMSPFGENHLFIAAIPVLAGFIALFLLRHHDTRWAIGGGGEAMEAEPGGA